MIKYRSLHKHKYQLMADYSIEVRLCPAEAIDTLFIDLSEEGILTIYTGYAWDGCSGPTIDDPTNMRAGLVHDALYQLLREGHISPGCRLYADTLFRDICIEDGMPKWRAKYYYKAVRWFAGSCAKPSV